MKINMVRKKKRKQRTTKENKENKEHELFIPGPFPFPQ